MIEFKNNHNVTGYGNWHESDKVRNIVRNTLEYIKKEKVFSYDCEANLFLVDHNIEFNTKLIKLGLRALLIHYRSRYIRSHLTYLYEKLYVFQHLNILFDIAKDGKVITEYAELYKLFKVIVTEHNNSYHIKFNITSNEIIRPYTYM